MPNAPHYYDKLLHELCSKSSLRLVGEGQGRCQGGDKRRNSACLISSLQKAIAMLSLMQMSHSSGVIPSLTDADPSPIGAIQLT